MTLSVSRSQRSCPGRGLREGLPPDPGMLVGGGEEKVEGVQGSSGASWKACRQLPPPRLFEQLCAYGPMDKPWYCLILV